MKNDINIKLIFEKPNRFNRESLSGGYSRKVDKIIDKTTNIKFTLKKIGEAEEEIKDLLVLCKYIQRYSNNFPSTAKLLDWEIIDGNLYTLSEFIEETEKRDAKINEIIDISSQAYKASILYDSNKHKELSFSKTSLQVLIENSVENYNIKYYQAYLNNETKEIIDWMMKWVNYFSMDKTFYKLYHEKTGFIHRDIHRRNIIISNNSPYLIDFDMAGIDNLLIDLVRPCSIFIDRKDFFPMYNKIKKQNKSKFTQTEIDIIDRVLVLDIIFMLGWDAVTILSTEENALKLEFIGFLKDRLHYLSILKNHSKELNLDFI